MILRLWKGWAELGRPDDYPRHFREIVLPELRAVAGFVDAELLKRTEDDRILFTVVTRWESMDAVKAFAGDDPETAVVHDAAAAVLIGFDDRVEHHELIEKS